METHQMEPFTYVRQNSEPNTSGSDTHQATVQQRRERGRIAQRQFRQRQIDAIRSLEAKLASYDSAFRSVREAMIVLESISEKTTSTQEQSEPFTLKLREATNQLSLAISQVNTFKSNHRSPIRGLRRRKLRPAPLPGPTNPSAPSENEASMTSISASTPANTTVTNDANIYSPFDLQYSPITSAQHEIISQQLANILPNPPGTDWADNTVTLDTVTSSSAPIQAQPQMPVFDFAPYIAERANTFSGQLYWATLSLVRKLLSGIGFQSELVRRIFSYTSRYESLELLRFRTKARLVFFSTGIMLDEPPSSSVHPLHARVSDDIVRAGGIPHLYLDAREVEEYISRKYTMNKLLVSGKIAARVASSILDLDGPEHAGIVSDSFLDQLAVRSICFGNGPRYHIGSIEQLAQHIMTVDAEVTI